MLMCVRLVALLTTMLAAQTAPAKPDFSGTWIIAQEQTNRLAGGTTVTAMSFGREFTIKQDAKSIAFERTSGFDSKGVAQTVSLIYQLDGSVTAGKTRPQGAPSDIATESKAVWDGVRLVLTTSTAAPRKQEVKRTLWLDADGFLIVEQINDPPGMLPVVRNVYQKK